MRGRMNDVASYVAPFKVGEALQGGAIGQVVATNSAYLKIGDHVSSMFGWREYFTAPAKGLEKVTPGGAPIQAYLGALGMPGLTAYAGLLKVAEAKPGETVLVSGAGGAVGSIVGQIAKAIGCTAIGLTGSDEKCRWLRETAGLDAAINYKTAGDLTAAIRKAAPDGIDAYFENVGGVSLDAALANMKVGGRMAICGMIDRYNATTPAPGPSNIVMVLARRLRVQGFIVSAYFDLMPQFRKAMAEWTHAGKMHWHETVVDGIENAPKAFLGLFKGDNLGKMLVKVGPDSTI